jgi:phage shock protein C
VSPRRLYRSRRDRQLAGVAGGIAEYLDVDPTVIRILWILSIFVGGFGILLYIIMAFIVPLEPAAGPAPGYGPGGPAWGAPASPAGGGAPGSPAWGAPAGANPAAAPGAAPADGAFADAGTEPGTDPGTGSTPGTDTEGGAPAGAAPAWGANPAWATPGAGWQPPVERGPGRGGLVVGVLLVVFGGIALTGALAPGWIAWPALGPVFLVALGVALLVGATRRSAAAS